MTPPPYRGRVRCGLLLLLLAVTLPGCGSGESPSVLLITVDTLRADALGVYGNPRARTPRMDRLAAEGVRFTKAKTVCPITLPAHLSILTGLYPAEHGVRDNDPAHPLPGPDLRDFETLAEIFRDRGYDTAAFVSASVVAARTGLDQGFDVYNGPAAATPGSLVYAERTGRKTAEHAAKWISDARRPFFAWVHIFDPHDPYFPPLEFRSGAAPTSPLAYADEVAYADHCVGILLDALDRDGLRESTLVVLTADHGEGLGEHGESTHAFLLYETTLAVPLILSRPGRLPSGERRHDLVSLVDLAPTVLHAALASDSERSFLEVPSRRVPVAETLYGYRHMGWAQLFCAWDGDGKLTRGVTDAWFDLATDPGELLPRATVPEDLAAALHSYREHPLRSGAGRGPALAPLTGHAYLSGVGRGRLRFIPVEENRKLRAPDGRAVDEIGRAIARVGKDDPARVRRDLLRLMKEDPANPSLPYWLGRNESAAGRHAEAAIAFSKSFELGHRETRVLSLWLKSLILSEQTARGIEVAEKNVAEVVPDTGVWVMVGTLQMQSGQEDTALRSLSKAEALARSERDRKLVSQFRHNLGQQKEQ